MITKQTRGYPLVAKSSGSQHVPNFSDFPRQHFMVSIWATNICFS